MSKDRFEEAVTQLIRATGDGQEIVTGWVLCASVKHPSMPNSDGYTVENSAGLPYHTQIGLLQASIDEKRGTVMGQIINDK